MRGERIGLGPAPLASVRIADRASTDPRLVGEALGVDVVVNGSLRHAGGELRIVARAISVIDGFQLWASRVDVPSA